MAKSDRDAGDFEFDSDQLVNLSKLAEAFVHEEVDADLFTELDQDYLEWVVNGAGSEPPADIDTKE
jgi:hypothetical protein